jgi:hypothetical protein
LQLLSQRFGELSGSARARVVQASAEQLGVYAERVFSSASLDEVLR